MSLPPVTVHIKRKATDEPVDFLHVQESNGKRQRRATEFVFSRQVESVNELASSPAIAPEGVRRIKQLPRSASSQKFDARNGLGQTQTQEAVSLNPATKDSTEAGQPTPTANSIPEPTSQIAAPTTPLSLKPQPRRFHISRSASSTPPTQSVFSGRVQKRTTLFVERRTRAKVSPTSLSSPPTPGLTPEPAHTTASLQKKPGQAARTSTAPSNNPPMSRIARLAPELRNVRLPSGLVAPWSLNDQQLVEEMQAYTLQEIGHSIAVADATKPGGSPAPHPIKKPSKFKPKIPKLRYHERHPEEFAAQSHEMEVEELVEDTDDDSEYIIDTYVRMAAGDMDVDSSVDKNFGFLVLDGQSDIDEFYSGEAESDEDEDYDEEDENAENYYTADYPDDEVESDDEYGRNPYQHANDDAAFSDDSDDGTKYQLTKKPAWLRKAEHGSDDDDEDD